MTDQTDDRLAEARRDYCAAMYVVARITCDRDLLHEVVRRLAAYGEPGCVIDTLTRGLALIFEKTDLVDLEPVVAALRDYTGRIVARFGERLDTGDNETMIDPDRIPADVRRLLDGDGGAA
jgi:hypothetical protein